MTFWIIVAVIAAAVLYAVFIYNKLVSTRQMSEEAWSGIDVQLKRRADLVPRLVNTVRAYADYEKALLTSVTELRANALAAPRAAERFDIERALGERLRQLVLLQEAYPQLKADANFRQLSDALVEVEDHLQYARRFYNGAVKQYLTRIESFPDLVVARLLGFAPEPFFETDDRAAVRVAL